jgi:hypothetical protein
VVEVEHHQRKALAIAAGAGQFVLGQVEKVAAVVGLGEVVGDRELAQPVFGLLQLMEQPSICALQRADDGTIAM